MLKQLVICGVLLMGGTACVEHTSCKKDSMENKDTLQIGPEDVLAGVNLTVGESKRLIAKGFCAMPEVRERLKKGMIIITRGTTNTYIAEELVGLAEPHGAFLTGHFVPEGTRPLNKDVKTRGELILKNGKLVEMAYADALKELGEGDIILKGANLLNYARKQAAVCIGAPDGGTTYRLLPYVGEGKARLIIPVGLEKETSANLEEYEKILNRKHEKLNFVPRLYLYRTGTVFTEIEALKQFADVEVFPYGAGGVAGREGGISLTLAGIPEEVEKALEAVRSVQGEQPFISSFK